MRGLRSPALCACVAAAALGLASVASAAADPYASLLAPSGTCGPAADQLGLDAATAQLAMQCLTNYARAQQGLGPLQLNSTLSAAGQAKLKSNISCSEFTHTPCGQPFDTVFANYIQGATSYLTAQTFQGYDGATLWSQEFGLRTPSPAATSTQKPAPKAKPKSHKIKRR